MSLLIHRKATVLVLRLGLVTEWSVEFWQKSQVAEAHLSSETSSLSPGPSLSVRPACPSESYWCLGQGERPLVVSVSPFFLFCVLFLFFKAWSHTVAKLSLTLGLPFYLRLPSAGRSQRQAPHLLSVSLLWSVASGPRESQASSPPWADHLFLPLLFLLG